MKLKARSKRTSLCNFNIINLEFRVWVWLLCVEDLFYGDGSEGVFAICSLFFQSARDESERPSMTKNHLSSCTLASTL